MILNPPGQAADTHAVAPSHFVPGEPGTTTLIPLGGCGEFGRNMTALICDGEVYLIDCGILFSSQAHHGVSGEIYDITPIVQRYGSPQGYLITHAHRDHIGGLGYFLAHWPAPVYATPWTLEYIKADLQRAGLKHLSSALHEVAVGATFAVGCLQCEYIAVNHSIPESQSLFIQTPYHRIAHSGDFKIDLDTSLENPCDLSRWQALAQEAPIDVLMCDSTNAHHPGPSPSEESTRQSLAEVMAAAQGRVFITTFSSNLWRLIHIIEAAKAGGRSVEVLGVGMQKSLAMAKSFGIYHETAPASSPTQKAVYIVSGSQLEPGSVLHRIMAGRYGDLRVEAGDTVVFSSRTIPGHEKAILQAISQLRWLGAHVITFKDKQNIHVSGHGYSSDIDMLESLVRPRYFIPVHGELAHLITNGYSRKHADVFMWKNLEGCLLHGSQIYPFAFAESFREVYVDGEFKELTDRALKHRRRVAVRGLLWISGAYYVEESRFVCGPEFDGTGLAVAEEKWQRSIRKDLRRHLKRSVETWLHREGSRAAPDDALDQFLAARIETFLQQSHNMKTWVRSRVWLV